jgi:hypothetical protein
VEERFEYLSVTALPDLRVPTFVLETEKHANDPSRNQEDSKSGWDLLFFGRSPQSSLICLHLAGLTLELGR